MSPVDVFACLSRGWTEVRGLRSTAGQPSLPQATTRVPRIMTEDPLSEKKNRTE